MYKKIKLLFFTLILFFMIYNTCFPKESLYTSYSPLLFQEINNHYEDFINNHVDINYFSFKKQIPDAYYDDLTGEFYYCLNTNDKGEIESQFMVDYSYYKEWTDYLYYETNGFINFAKKEEKPLFLIPREAFIGLYILDYHLDLKAGIINIPKIENFNRFFNLYSSPLENHFCHEIGFSGINLKHFFDENWSAEIYFSVPSFYTFSNSILWDNYFRDFLNISFNEEDIAYQKENPKNVNYMYGFEYKKNENIFSISYFNGNYHVPLPFYIEYVNQLPIIALKYPEYKWLELSWQLSFLNERLKLKNNLAYIEPGDWCFQGNKYWGEPFFSYFTSIDYKINSSTFIQLAYISDHRIKEWEESSPLLKFEAKKSYHNMDLYYSLGYNFNFRKLNHGIGIKYQLKKDISLEGGYFFNDRGFFQIRFAF